MNKQPGVRGMGADRKLIVLAGAGLVGIVVSWIVSGGERFWANWILWFLFLLTIGLGSLFIVALEHVVGARWSIPLRRVPERLSSLVLIVAPIALLALLSLDSLYSWTSPEALANPIIAGKRPWLNVPFFIARVIACLLLWGLAWWILVRGSIKQDKTRDARFNLRARRFAPLFMIIFGITITIVAFDWISSMEPEWYSDIFGVYIFAGTFLAGLAATTLALLYLQSRRLKDIRATTCTTWEDFSSHSRCSGLTSVLPSTCLCGMPISRKKCSGTRNASRAWGPILLGLAVFHFLVPFFLLIPRDAKRDPRFLFWTAAIMLFSHWLDLYWMIFPVLDLGPLFGLPEISFSILFVSAALLWIRFSMTRGADMPAGDPLLSEGLEFRL